MRTNIDFKETIGPTLVPPKIVLMTTALKLCYVGTYLIILTFTFVCWYYFIGSVWVERWNAQGEMFATFRKSFCRIHAKVQLLLIIITIIMININNNNNIIIVSLFIFCWKKLSKKVYRASRLTPRNAEITPEVMYTTEFKSDQYRLYTYESDVTHYVIIHYYSYNNIICPNYLYFQFCNSWNAQNRFFVIRSDLIFRKIEFVFFHTVCQKL